MCNPKVLSETPIKPSLLFERISTHEIYFHFSLPLHFYRILGVYVLFLIISLDSTSILYLVLTLIEFFWSDFTFKQQSSRIYRSAGTPVLFLSTLVYSEVALECLLGSRSIVQINKFKKVSFGYHLII